MDYETLEQRIQQKYAAVTNGGAKQINPGTWAMILDIIMKVLASCTAQHATAANISHTARNRPVLARLMVRRQMRGADLDRSDAHAVVETVAMLGADATEEEVAAVMRMELPVGGE